MKKTKRAAIRRFVIATLATSIIAMPLYLVIVGGMMSLTELHHRPPILFPRHPTTQYYVVAWQTMAPYLKNSCIIAFGVVALTLVFAPPAGFALAKLRLRVGGFLYALIFLLQMLPGVIMVIPMFLMFYKFGLINTRSSVILAITAGQIPFASLILSIYMRTLPDELFESAVLDGASVFQCFWRLALPLSKPALATVGIFAFMAGWGDLMLSLSFIQKKALQPASVGLATFTSVYGTDWTSLMAAAVFYAAPPLIIALIAGRQLASGLLAGAFK